MPSPNQGGAIAVSVSPSAVAISPGSSFTFTGTVRGISGSQSAAVTWAVQEGSTGGTVDGSGKYSAPATAGSYHVTATSVADPSKSGAATIQRGHLYRAPPPGPSDGLGPGSERWHPSPQHGLQDR